MHASQSFQPGNTAIVLVDHQPGVLAMVGSLPADTVTRNAGILARLGDGLGIPTVVTTTRETLGFLGTTVPSVREGAPGAYEARIRREGTLNAFHDPAFVATIKRTGRRNLVIAGLLTDVCLFHSVVSALESGYRVHVVVDASGTSTSLGDAVTYDRLRTIGAIITTTYGVLFELYPNLSTPDGRKAEAVVSGSLVAA